MPIGGIQRLDLFQRYMHVLLKESTPSSFRYSTLRMADLAGSAFISSLSLSLSSSLSDLARRVQYRTKHKTAEGRKKVRELEKKNQRLSGKDFTICTCICTILELYLPVHLFLNRSLMN